ncbi:YgcG family protein [Pseudomonas synxantha]|uniref:YgcG family protein n=1 Tax=Pseudomonas synxantha TaxID=47883 RepID=A0ABS0UPT1_9PSED|nr:YgcG family protein [Pseudomonas synxantha]MBI6567620.1 YgcG family protein [Pseudomonas synxantha]MBI6584085.1 YgcG family protein [Pseudomonas synxantha]MBI6645356.1 YgcG family protein [Pseudomonas synxantha]
MVMILRQSVLSLLALLLVGVMSLARADTSPIGVALDQRVIDLTNTLDSTTTQRLKNQLAELEQRKGAQVAVLLVPTTGSDGIEDYANQLFRAWKLGRKDVDDGILLVVAKDDRKVRIEVGYGLEGIVTDLLAHRIIEERITPAFRQGDFAGGIQQGVNALTVLVDGGDLPKVAEPRLPLGATAVLLAFVFGAVGGVLIVTRKLDWRHALIATVVLTVPVVVFVGGAQWPLYLLVFPLNMLIGAAIFGALWRARTIFYCALLFLIYIVGLVVVNQYTEVNFFDWLMFLVGACFLLWLHLLLLVFMKDAWGKSRMGFIVRLFLAMMVYLTAVLIADGDGWQETLPGAFVLSLFIFIYNGSGAGSSSGGGFLRSSSSSHPSSGRSSSAGNSSSGNSSSGGSGRGGSSGGGGASGSW